MLAHRPEPSKITWTDAGRQLDLDSEVPASAVDQDKIDLPPGLVVSPVEGLRGGLRPTLRGEDLVDHPGLKGLSHELRDASDVMPCADEALACAGGIGCVSLGCSSVCVRWSATQIGQQGDEEPALEDAEITIHCPCVKVELLADPCPVDLASGRAEHGVEHFAGGAGV